MQQCTPGPGRARHEAVPGPSCQWPQGVPVLPSCLSQLSMFCPHFRNEFSSSFLQQRWFCVSSVVSPIRKKDLRLGHCLSSVAFILRTERTWFPLILCEVLMIEIWRDAYSFQSNAVSGTVLAHISVRQGQ